MQKWLTSLMLVCATGSAAAEEFTARVIVVLDGDTVMAVWDCKQSAPKADGIYPSSPCSGNKPVKIRLAEIDAPEKAQPGGAESGKSLADMVLEKPVKVRVLTMDKYVRLVAQLGINGLNVNEEQVRRGMAWEYSSYHRNKTYIALQSEARRSQRGLWTQTDPTPPWEWRKLHQADATAPVQTPTSPSAQNTGNFTCGSKRHCAQMRSCAEARFYLTQCGVKSLDGNGDGVPCETLCANQ